MNYEVVLGPAAEEYLLSMSLGRRAAMVKCLRSELQNGPNRRATFRFVWDAFHGYSATPLTFNGVVVIYRRLIDIEFDDLKKQRRLPARVTAAYLVVDFLSPESAIYLRSNI